jgi:hypothetical protein
MKMKLSRIGGVPYGGRYEINRPDLGMVGMGTAFDMLETNVRRYRKANGIPTGLGFSEELEQEICKLYPQECEHADPNLPSNIRLSFEDVVHGTQVLASFKLAGSPLVPKQEAERRASICSQCKLLVPFARPCGGLCGALKTAVDELVGGYEIAFDNDLRACGICHCFAASQVRIPYEHLEKGLTEQMKVQFQAAKAAWGCWKVQDSSTSAP